MNAEDQHDEELRWCEDALTHATRIGWREGVAHYTARLDRAKRRALAAEYHAWAIGERSEISDEAMHYGREQLEKRRESL